MRRHPIVLVLLLAAMVQASLADEPKYAAPPRWITAKELTDQLVQDSGLVVVDVRPESDYQRCHLQGSLNAPLSTLPAMSFLKEREVVLLGDGMDYVALERAHSRLDEQGFRRVGLLAGGWPAWRQNKMAKSGMNCGSEEKNVVEVNRLAQEAHQPDLTAWAFNEQTFQLGGQLGLRTILIEPGQSVDQLETIVAERIAAYSQQPLQRIVILVDPQTTVDGLVEALQRRGAPTVFILEDASVTLQHYVQRQNRLVSAQHTKVERSGAMGPRMLRAANRVCATCP